MGDNITAYTSMMSIVSMALDECEKSTGDMDRVWILAHRGYADVLFDFAGQTKTIRQPVLPNMTAPLPPDCISWSKIGILNDRGEINTLKVNTALTTFRDNNPNRLEDLTPDINNSIGNIALVPYYSNYYYGSGCYQLYGVGGGVITYGDCKVDELNRVIILNEEFKYPAVMIEYVCSPILDNDFQIPTILQEAIIAFIKWKLKLGSRQEYYAAAESARRRMPKKKVILQTINQVLRESEGGKLRS